MSDERTSLPVTHDREQSQFHAVVDGHRCLLDYRLDGTTMVITHTWVPAAVGGRGIASILTAEAVDTAIQSGWTIVPACSYAATWLRRHPEQAAKVATKR